MNSKSVTRPTVRVRDVIAALFDGCSGVLELRTKSSAGVVRATFVEPTNTDLIAAFVAAHRDDDVWFGVSTRDGSGGALAHCEQVGALYVDVDGAPDEAIDFPLPPSIVIQSGGGRHLYWLLKEAIDVQAETEALYSYLQRLSVALCGDPVAAEPARVLRLPGTWNQKYTPKRPVTIEIFEPTRRYNPSEFDPILLGGRPRHEWSRGEGDRLESPHSRRHGTQRRRGTSMVAVQG